MVAEQAAVGLQLPSTRAMEQVDEKGLLLVATFGRRDAWVGLDGVTGLCAADGADDPTDRGDPFVVASSKEREAEKADLVQQGNSELPGGRALEKGLTDREVRRRIGRGAPKLVPCECDGRAPVE